MELHYRTATGKDNDMYSSWGFNSMLQFLSLSIFLFLSLFLQFISFYSTVFGGLRVFESALNPCLKEKHKFCVIPNLLFLHVTQNDSL